MNKHELTPRQFIFGLLLAVGLHLLILALFAFDVIPQEYHRDGYPFWFHQGGDTYGYFNQAVAIQSGEFLANKYPLGFPLLMQPAMLLNPQAGHDALVQPVAFFWAVIMFPIGQWLLAKLTLHLTHKRALALLSVWIWTALPLLSYVGMRLLANPQVAEITSVHLTWAQMMSDGAATFFTLLILYLFLRAREKEYPLRWVLVVGALCGLLMLIRLTGALTAGTLGLLLLFEKHWRVAIVLAAVTFLVFSPQMIFNATFFDSPFTSGYSVLDDLPPDGLFSLRYLLEAIGALWERLGILLALLVTSGLILVGISLRWMWHKNRFAAHLLELWLGSYLLIYSIYYYSWIGGLPRFLMPMYPALAILAAIVLWWMYHRFQTNSQES